MASKGPAKPNQGSPTSLLVLASEQEGQAETACSNPAYELLLPRGLGFWHSFWCLSRQNEKTNQEKRIWGSQYQVSLFMLRTSRFHKASLQTPGERESQSFNARCLQKKKVESGEEERSYFITYQPQSILATWRLSWVDREAWNLSRGSLGLFPKSMLLACFLADGASQPGQHHDRWLILNAWWVKAHSCTKSAAQPTS